MGLDWGKWLLGLWAALIVGVASVIDSGLVLTLSDPDHFNINTGLKRTLITLAVLAALTGVKVAAAYLKQSPVPVQKEIWTEEQRAAYRKSVAPPSN